MQGPAGELATGLHPRRPSGAKSLTRTAFFILGWLCLAIGVAGIVLPLVPGTLFLILAAACFTRSSPRFEAWLLAHPTLGPPIREWRAKGAIPRRIKWIACLSLLGSWVLLLVGQTPRPVVFGCLVLFGWVAGYIVTRPEG
jgi:uncharacterized membrane protein YbaN (DUF454 family)